MDQSLFTTPRGSLSSIGDSGELEANLTLSERLKVFKSSSFDPNAYVASKSRSMNEKEIRHLCAYLVDLKKASAEEMRKSVLANYSAFIRTSKEISDLEGELLSMRNLLSTQAALVHGLAEGCELTPMISGDEDPDMDDILDEKTDISKTEKWLIGYLETLEVLLAEKRVDEAMAALDEGEKMSKEISEGKTLSPSLYRALQAAIDEHRQKLADQLAETICQPSTRSAEIRSTALALKNLGDGPRAHTLLLHSHQETLQRSIKSLQTSRTGAFTATLSQLVFSTISQAASDSLSMFAEEEPAYTSELVTWAVTQAEQFSVLLKKCILASSAAAGGLRVASECVHVCMSHCYLLEATGLALSPVLLKYFKPFVEQALKTNLKRIEQSTSALAAADDWFLAYAPTSNRHSGLPPPSHINLGSFQPKLSRSAHKFNSMVQELFEDVGPLEILQLDVLAVEGLLQGFNFYVNLLINALPGSVVTENLEGHKIVKIAETEAQQIALLANAILLADELLPRAVVKLSHSSKGDDSQKRGSDKQRPPEQRELKKRLQREVDHLRDSFCRQHALEFIFTEDGEARLNALIYLVLDGREDQPEWFPSPIFQELFAKLTEVAGIAADVFVGRERFATVLLMRLTETVVLWLSDDQAFWEEIETGATPLGPVGLQQLYLDMQFVMIFSSQGRYLSRHLHQAIKNIIARAIEAVAATGLDPNSILPEDEWFVEVSEIAIKMLTGRAAFDSVEGGDYSPTSSVQT
ncbi:exocyst complex component EXO84A [Cajanus cajan]|uniref:Exocyst complex component 8 n=1 Tax=Cajanus cajan TaxID=3821 RepID=A0A151TFY9_CAJCA|nr:exocyst complex component EXO84A [Cajanus cajan]KYP65948.1 Exocyst complex component 8 [Cajanus cajan]